MSLQEEGGQTLLAFRTTVKDLANEELAKLVAEEDRLTSQLGRVRDQIKGVRAVLRSATNGNTPGPVRKRAPKQQSAFRLSEERGALMNEWLAGNEDEITSKTVHAKFPEWSESYCNMALKYLREAGALRLSGTSGSMNIYRSMI